jgi:hypothetical protein
LDKLIDTRELLPIDVDRSKRPGNPYGAVRYCHAYSFFADIKGNERFTSSHST